MSELGLLYDSIRFFKLAYGKRFNFWYLPFSKAQVLEENCKSLALEQLLMFRILLDVYLVYHLDPDIAFLFDRAVFLVTIISQIHYLSNGLNSNTGSNLGKRRNPTIVDFVWHEQSSLSSLPPVAANVTPGVSLESIKRVDLLLNNITQDIFSLTPIINFVAA